MLEELLIQMMGLQGHYVEKVEMKDGILHIWFQPTVRLLTCPHCGRGTASIHSQWTVSLSERPILGHPATLHLPHFRIRCECQSKPVGVAPCVQDDDFLVTRRLADEVPRMAKETPIKLTAALLGLHWNTARDIDLRHLKKRIDAIEPVAPNSIGVDEVSYHKGHQYLTIVSDHSSHRIVYVAKGRKSENLKEFFEKRCDPLAAKRLEAASIDMWDPYEKTIRECAPQAMIVYDKFHLLRMLNECVDGVRKHEQARLSGEGRKLLKHKRFLLLKGQERLRPDQQQSLKELLEQNRSLHSAHLLKEQFRQMYSIEQDESDPPASCVQKAFQYLAGWIERASESGLAPFASFVKRVKKRWAGILNYFRYPITNGLSEGLNNKISSLKKRAYGFRNLEYFMLKIYQQGGLI